MATSNFKTWLIVAAVFNQVSTVCSYIGIHVCALMYVSVCIAMCIHKDTYIPMTVVEITVNHWSFSNQFQHLANQNSFWSAILPVHFPLYSSQ